MLSPLGVDLALTSNGVKLPEMAHDLAAAGLRRINVSLDSLRPDTFAALTRRNDLERVLAGVDAAPDAGPEPQEPPQTLARPQAPGRRPARRPLRPRPIGRH